jgi:hypothetical protein
VRIDAAGPYALRGTLPRDAVSATPLH